MLNIVLTALTAVPVTLLAWLAYNWAGKPILDMRTARLDSLKIAELYGFTGYGYSEEETNKAKTTLSEVAVALRALSRSQRWSARLYCRALGYDLELASSVLMGLAGLVGAALGKDNTSRRDGLDALYVSLAANQHLSAERTNEIREKIRTALALPRG
jgi:hypothetical protein